MLKYPCAITQLGEWASLSMIQGSTELTEDKNWQDWVNQKGKPYKLLHFTGLRNLRVHQTWSHKLCVGGTLGPLKVPLLVLKIFLCRELRCPTGPEGDTPHLPELFLNGASQHFLVDVMNNAASALQLRGKDSLVSHHKSTSTATCQREKSKTYWLATPVMLIH